MRGRPHKTPSKDDEDDDDGIGDDNEQDDYGYDKYWAS